MHKGPGVPPFSRAWHPQPLSLGPPLASPLHPPCYHWYQSTRGSDNSNHCRRQGLSAATDQHPSKPLWRLSSLTLGTAQRGEATCQRTHSGRARSRLQPRHDTELPLSRPGSLTTSHCPWCWGAPGPHQGAWGQRPKRPATPTPQSCFLGCTRPRFLERTLGGQEGSGCPLSSREAMPTHLFPSGWTPGPSTSSFPRWPPAAQQCEPPLTPWADRP